MDAQKADARPSTVIQEGILALGPEISALHMQAADLFKGWLAEQKAAAAEAERRRRQEEADNVTILCPCLCTWLYHVLKKCEQHFLFCFWVLAIDLCPSSMTALASM